MTAVALAAIIGVNVGACTQRIAGTPTSQRTSAQPTSADPPAPTTSSESRSDPSESRDGEPSASAGRAPYDPCTVVTWDDVPAAARPTPENQQPPAPRQPQADDAYEVGCVFQGQPLQVMVVWGREDRMPTTPRGNQGEKVLDIGGHPALMLSTITDEMQQACVVNVALGEERGVAGVAALTPMSQAGSLEAAPCVVVQQLAQQIVGRTS